MIYGATSHIERTKILEAFKTSKDLNTDFLSKVGDVRTLNQETLDKTESLLISEKNKTSPTAQHEKPNGVNFNTNSGSLTELRTEHNRKAAIVRSKEHQYTTMPTCRMSLSNHYTPLGSRTTSSIVCLSIIKIIS